VVGGSGVTRTVPSDEKAARGGTAQTSGVPQHKATKRQENLFVEEGAWWLKKMSAGPSSSVYEYGKVLGRGASSVVREGVNRRTGEKFACKIMVHKGAISDAR
jgi:hypothetical protein